MGRMDGCLKDWRFINYEIGSHLSGKKSNLSGKSQGNAKEFRKARPVATMYRHRVGTATMSRYNSVTSPLY